MASRSVAGRLGAHRRCGKAQRWSCEVARSCARTVPASEWLSQGPGAYVGPLPPETELRAEGALDQPRRPGGRTRRRATGGQLLGDRQGAALGSQPGAAASALVAARVPGFGVLDWERTPQNLARLCWGPTRRSPAARRGGHRPAGSRRCWIRAATAPPRRGLHVVDLPQHPPLRPDAGQRVMRTTLWAIRRRRGRPDSSAMNRAVKVEGVCLLLQNQIFVIGAEMASGSVLLRHLQGRRTRPRPGCWTAW